MDNSIFTFLGHTFQPEKGLATFFYGLETPEKKYNFTETLQFNPIAIPNTKYQILNTVLDNLLLILGISYWKTYCPKTIKIKGFSLTKEQAEFWNTVYTKGLGEFFYKNDIDSRNLIHFPFVNDVILSEQPEPKDPINVRSSNIHTNRSLVFFGGGKDSIVSAELLKKANIPFDLFVVDPVALQKNGAEIAGATTVAFKREIDPQLFEQNKQGALNGHIPISALWAFMGVFAAILYDYSYLITSNEHSANYGNVEYMGEEINHQWSKSLEFEQLLREYIAKNISHTITYFSLLRPLYEIKIAQLFANHNKYFEHFSSCNKNFKIKNPQTGTRWCGECPKCLFVFLLLSAFIDKKVVLDIFGKNLLDDYSLVHLVRELLNLENFKPFECVGTPEETQLALSLIAQKKEYQNDVLVSLFLQSFPINQTEIQKLQEKLLQAKLPACVPHEFTSMINSI